MTDRIVLVTGGAGNVGRAVTRAFLASGDRVAVPVYKTDAPEALDELRSEHHDRLHPFALDLTPERGAEAAVREVVEWGGRLDVVVHMMGGYSGGTPLGETPVEAWQRMMDLNLNSAFLVTRFALPRMQDAGGSFVFVSSRAARQASPGQAAYAVSKAGLLTLAEAIAAEYGAAGIRANAVLPGTVDTPANRRQMPDADHARWTDPAEIARVILFLTSPAAAAISGAAIPVYGDA
jgi:NAD(P)-dependent dehydrogenase (short-subunit alcohol dehydrogenase family)